MKRTLTLLTAALTFGIAQAQTLTVWTHFQDESLAWLEGEVAAFQAVFGTEVELVYVPVNEMVQNLLLNAPEGQGPDLVATVPHDQLGQLAEAGVLAGVEQFSTPAYLADLTEQARRPCGAKVWRAMRGVPTPQSQDQRTTSAATSRRRRVFVML